MEYANNATPPRADRGQPVTQRMRKRQHPLTHRHSGKNAIYQLRGRIRHTPGPAAIAYAPALAGIGDQTVQAARITVNAKEAARQDATIQKRAKLALHKPGTFRSRSRCAARNVSRFPDTTSYRGFSFGLRGP